MSVSQVLVNAGWAGSELLTILSGGEVLPITLAQQLRSLARRVINYYGPAEVTIACCLFDVPAHWDPVSEFSVTPVGVALHGYVIHVIVASKEVGPGIPGSFWHSNKEYVSSQIFVTGVLRRLCAWPSPRISDSPLLSVQ